MIRKIPGRAVRAGASAVACGAGAYAAYAAVTWLRYGHAADAEAADPLLDRFMPRYDVVDRMAITVRAPAEIALAAAEEQDLMHAPGLSAIFRIRRIARRAPLDAPRVPQPLMEQVRSLGWVELSRTPGQQVVMGAIMQPWKRDLAFHPVAPEAFAAFDDPGYVKIAWTLRTDPLGPRMSTFRSETRAIGTDETARLRFRRYWAFAAPGVALIRRFSRGPIRREAERRTSVLEGQARDRVGGLR